MNSVNGIVRMSRKSGSILETNLLQSHLVDKQTLAQYLQLREKQLAKQQWHVHPESCKTANAINWCDTVKADCNQYNCASKKSRRKIVRKNNGNNGEAIFSLNADPLWSISTATTKPTATTQYQSSSHHYHRHSNKSTLPNKHHNQRHANNNTQHHNNPHIKCNLHTSKANLDNSQHQQQHQKTHLQGQSSMLVGEPNNIFQYTDKKGRFKNFKNAKYHHRHHYHQSQCHDEMPSLATSANRSQQHETRLSPKVYHKMSQQQLLCMFQVVSPLKAKSAQTTIKTKNFHHNFCQLDGSSAGVTQTTPISCSPLKDSKHFNVDYETVLQFFNSISKPSDQDVIFGNARLLLKCYGWEKSRIEWLEQLECKNNNYANKKLPSVLKTRI